MFLHRNQLSPSSLLAPYICRCRNKFPKYLIGSRHVQSIWPASPYLGLQLARLMGRLRHYNHYTWVLQCQLAGSRRGLYSRAGTASILLNWEVTMHVNYMDLIVRVYTWYEKFLASFLSLHNANLHWTWNTSNDWVWPWFAWGLPHLRGGLRKQIYGFAIRQTGQPVREWVSDSW